MVKPVIKIASAIGGLALTLILAGATIGPRLARFLGL
jgi:hypothetical protein